MNDQRWMLIYMVAITLAFLFVGFGYIRMKRARGPYARQIVTKTKPTRIIRTFQVGLGIILIGGGGFEAYQNADEIGTFFSLAIHPKDVINENMTLIKSHKKLGKAVPKKSAAKPRRRKDGFVQRKTTAGVTVWAAPDARFDPGGKGKLVPLNQ